MKNLHLPNQCIIHKVQNNNENELGGEYSLQSMKYFEYRKMKVIWLVSDVNF